MKDETKEILDDLRTYKDRYEYFLFNNLSFSDRDYKAKILLDYITNLQEQIKEYQKALDETISEKMDLQEENERLKKRNKEIYDGFIAAQEELSDYATRNEKVFNKIQYIIDYGFDYDGLNTVESLKGLIDMLVDYAIKSRNILNGGDEE